MNYLRASKLSPLFPLDTRLSLVTPFFPLDTKNRGVHPVGRIPLVIPTQLCSARLPLSLVYSARAKPFPRPFLHETCEAKTSKNTPSSQSHQSRGCASRFGHLRPRETLKKVHKLAREAAQQGAQLVLFPEAFVSGYPRGLDFGAVVGSRTDKGREDFRRYWESSVDVPGPAVNELARAARNNKIYLVVGVVERDGGTLHCCVLFFAPDGTYLGKHRKVMPTASERLVWGFGDGSTLPVFDTPLGKLGVVICWENYLPLLRAAMYAKGIEIYCAPTADSRDSWIATVRHIATEGRCFVLSCNQFNRRRDFPSDYDSAFGKDPDSVITRGGSGIVDPFGKCIGGTKLRRRSDSPRGDRSRPDHSR